MQCSKQLENLSFKSNDKDQCRLIIGRKKMVEDLLNLGCMQNKTKYLQFPSSNIIPKNLLHHFIRGYFDGDGCVWEGKRKIMKVKDKKHKNHFRYRVVQNVKFNICGNISFITELQKVLVTELNFRFTKLGVKKSVKNYLQLEYSGRKQMETFYNWLYKDSNIFLTRKKIKFEKILNRANIQ